MRPSLPLFLAVLLAPGAPAWADVPPASASSRNVRATLLSEAASIQPGRPFCSFQSTDGLLTGRGVTLDQIAGELDAGRIVVNRTNLAGRFDVDLRWTPEPSASDAADAPPGLTTALREQLGLRTQRQRAPMDVLVIDSAERPTPD